MTTDLRLVYMIVVPFVGAPNRHDNKVLLSVQTKVVHRGFEEVCVGTEPLGEVDGREKNHGDDEQTGQERALASDVGDPVESCELPRGDAEAKSYLILSRTTHDPPGAQT
jgi:hypothetical protein